MPKGWGRQGYRHLRRNLRRGWSVLLARGPGQIEFWLIALLIGIFAGLAALVFRIGIGTLQRLAYGTDDLTMASVAGHLPWWWVLAVPILGGLAVGLILDRFTPDGRVRAVADVIEGAALEGGRVEIREGLASAAASVITLGTGGSSGREGPVVHLAGVISTLVANRIKATPVTGRELLGCAVAGAVAASFNAPIAGALFAHEVVLRNFAMRAFAPIAISAVAGTVINRMRYGGVTEFQLPAGGGLGFYIELPAFMLLGLVCALVAAGLMAGIFRAETIANRIMARTGWPRWLRPTLAGAALGMIAIPYPHIIGVGYEATSAALTGRLDLWTAVVFALVKAVAVAITLGGRMGGGVFSPALVMGALTGLAFGILATAIAPHASGNETLYALAGMGAVGAAVLGAPISTAMIVFELTGDWQTGIAVMTTISLSTALASRMVERSFFLTQLKRRGVHIAEGPQVWLPRQMRVTAVMREIGSKTAPAADLLRNMVADGQMVADQTTLGEALSLFDRTGAAFYPIVRQDGASPEILGAVYHIDALRGLATALGAVAAEQHG
nr:chloride channel protein [Paracoccus ravus]